MTKGVPLLSTKVFDRDRRSHSKHFETQTRLEKNKNLKPNEKKDMDVS